MTYTNDVFIAYHGTFSNCGTYTQAKKIKNYLQSKGLNPYLFLEKDGISWDETIYKVVTSKCMLVIVNDNVEKDERGLMLQNRNGVRYQLYAEIHQLHQQVSNGEKSAQVINYVYCGGKKGQEAKIECMKLIPWTEALNNIIGADCNLDSENEDLSIIYDWVKMAMSITDNFDSKKNNTVQKESETQNGDSLEEIFNRIERELFKSNCVVVVGPLLNDKITSFSDGVGNNFYQRCESLYRRSATSLNSALETHFSDKSYVSEYIQNLVKFPFQTYLTVDKYANINTALNIFEKRENKGVLIKSENEIYKLDLQQAQIPIIQLPVKNAMTDEIETPSKEIISLIKMLLQKRLIVYVGFDSEYDGYKSVCKFLKSIIGEDNFTCYYNFVFTKDHDIPLIYNDNNLGVKKINMSHVDFINQLMSTNDLFKRYFDKKNINNPFVTELFTIASTPTETQAIELLIKQLSFDISHREDMGLEQIIDKYQTNVDCLMEIKPNFRAFKNCWLEIKVRLGESEDPDLYELENIVKNIVIERENISGGIRKKGKAMLKGDHKNILLFSQSLRVVEFLRGAKPEIAKQISLWVCECRPKSESPFQDAKNMCAKIIGDKGQKKTFEKITIIPDMAAFNMMERGLIDLLVLGAHDIVMYSGKPINFVNTCGSKALMEKARKKSIPIYIIAEKGKFTDIQINQTTKGEKLTYPITYGHESTIYRDFDFMLWMDNNNISMKNIGYDFCDCFKGVTIINELNDGIYNCEDFNVDVDLIDSDGRGNE